MIKVGIAGAAGYTAGELIRMLVAHPGVELRYLQSESHRGEPIGKVHRDLIYSDRVFSDLDYTDIDVLFLCMGHGVSTRFLQQNPVPASVRVIDLGNDFRLKFRVRVAGTKQGDYPASGSRGESRLFRHGDRIGLAAFSEWRGITLVCVGLRHNRGDGSGTATHGGDALQ